MRKTILLALTFAVAACGSATDTPATRYNFAVIAGENQSSVAGEAHLVAPITSQLTRDPQGQFATRLFNFLAPAVAYAQSIGLPGTPVQGAIVCGRVAAFGEPQVVPLCAFTLADGKAANTVQGGTKAGTYNVLFTAQVPSEAPVEDSTTVTVQSGPADPQMHNGGGLVMPPPIDTLPANAVTDIYGNSIPFAIQSDSLITVAGTVAGTVAARRFSFKTPPTLTNNVLTPILNANGIQIAWLDYSLYGSNVGGGWYWTTRGLATVSQKP